MNGDAAFRWDDGLTGPARNIASLDHTPIRVLAGLGTGRTFALMRRVARLIVSRVLGKLGPARSAANVGSEFVEGLAV